MAGDTHHSLLCNLRSGDGKHACPMLRMSANKCRRRGQTDEEKGKQMMRKKPTRCWGRRPLDDEEKGYAGVDEGSKLIPRESAIEAEQRGKQLRKRATRCERRGQTEAEKYGIQMVRKRAKMY